MKTWEPITIVELQKEIKKGVLNMSLSQTELWKRISIYPEKWTENEFGKEGGGFWAVAIIDNQVIWYNDIEDGFNISSFSENGKIDEYWADQDELNWVIKKLATHHNKLR
jgi:hypothetical protein